MVCGQPDPCDDHTLCVRVAAPNPLAAAERAVVEAAMGRHNGWKTNAHWRSYQTLSRKLDEACAELDRLRAAQESGTQEILDK